MQFSMKLHETEEGLVVAACDKELLGKTFTEGKKQLFVDEEFYGGELVALVDILDALTDCATSNFVGDQLIDELVANDILEKSEIERVDGIPHAHLHFL